MTRTLGKRYIEFCGCCKKVEKSFCSANEAPTSFTYDRELLFSKKSTYNCRKCILKCPNKKHCSKKKIPVCAMINYEVVKNIEIIEEMNSSSEEEEDLDKN